MDQSSHYNYLGHHITTEPTKEKQKVKHRTSLRWSAFGRIRFVFKSNTAMIPKGAAYNQCVHCYIHKPGILLRGLSVN